MRRFVFAPIAFAGLAAITTQACAQDSLQNASNGSAAGSHAIGDLTMSGMQTASAVGVLPVSVAATGPVVVGGSATLVGASATQAGGDAFREAGDSAAFGATPLPVGKAVIVAQPAPKVPYDAQTPAPKS
jgi:hypothetical protein